MTKNNYGDSFVTEPATVRWSHLMKPDEGWVFGAIQSEDSAGVVRVHHLW